MKTRLWGIVLVSVSFMVSKYSFNLPFPYWIPFIMLCVPVMYIGFMKILYREK
jgi:hypothetical protein